MVTANMSQRENPDPTGYRVGVAPMAEIADKMKEVCKEAREYVSRNRATENKCLNEKEMEELVSLLKGAVMIAYPAYHGMPPWDHAYLILEESGDLQSLWPDLEWLNAPDSACWFAGRELYRGKSFGEQVNGGTNEKSTFVGSADARSSRSRRKAQERPLRSPRSTRRPTKRCWPTTTRSKKSRRSSSPKSRRTTRTAPGRTQTTSRTKW